MVQMDFLASNHVRIVHRADIFEKAQLSCLKLSSKFSTLAYKWHDNISNNKTKELPTNSSLLTFSEVPWNVYFMKFYTINRTCNVAFTVEKNYSWFVKYSYCSFSDLSRTELGYLDDLSSHFSMILSNSLRCVASPRGTARHGTALRVPLSHQMRCHNYALRCMRRRAAPCRVPRRIGSGVKEPLARTLGT